MRAIVEWNRVVELIGFEASEKIREEFKSETIRVPSKLPKAYIVPLVKSELKISTYKDIAKKYDLHENTVRNYEKWKVKGNLLISPDGREYFKEDPI